MRIQDLVVTPIILTIIFSLALWIRGSLTDKNVRIYFIPGLALRIIGAISLGLVYQYYYQGGDTFNYFDRGSKFIYEAFQDSPLKALQLIFANGSYDTNTFEYASKIIYYQDLPSYFVVRLAGFFDIFTFHTYSATATLFAVFSFSGAWAMFMALYRLFPRLHLYLAIALFFIPSVFFWGSGILKDSVTLGALGWGTYSFIQMFIMKKRFISSSIILLLSFYIIYHIKIYILLCFVPALLVWYYLENMRNIRNAVLKAMIFPFTMIFLITGGYFSVKLIGESNRRYNLERLSYTAESTARWLSFVSEKQEGSGYTLGDFDYSSRGIIRKIPAAIWVTLFRPYVWEAKNPVMLLSAFESSILLVFAVYVLIQVTIRKRLVMLLTNPVIVFCFIYSIIFAFAIGISTYNFGSLVRYKIPILPFFIIGLFIWLTYSKRPRKFMLYSSGE